MNLKYVTQDNGVYLIAEFAEGTSIDSMTLGMITNNRIPGLARAVYFQQDQVKYIKYNISSQTTLQQYLKGQVNRAKLIGVLRKIADAILQAEDYMIDSSSILLQQDFIYVTPANQEVSLVCVPVLSAGKGMEDFAGLIREILMNTQFDYSENCGYVARLLNYVNQQAAFSVRDFKTLLEELMYGGQAAAQQTTGVTQQPSVPVSGGSQSYPYQAADEPLTTLLNEPNPMGQSGMYAGEQPKNTVESQPPVIPQTGSYQGVIPSQQKNGGAREDVSVPTETGKKKGLFGSGKEKKSLFGSGKEKEPAKKAEKKDTKKNRKKEKMPTGFAVPGAESTANPNTGKGCIPYAIPGGQNSIAGSQNSVSGTHIPQQMIQTVEGDFGETAILSNVLDETWDLSAVNTGISKPQKKKILIRLKNNERIPIQKSQFRIGRGTAELNYCDVDYRITDNIAVGRKHAEVIIRGEEYFVMDLNSKNHTYVNGQMIPGNVEYKIMPGARIRLANEEFEFQVYQS